MAAALLLVSTGAGIVAGEYLFALLSDRFGRRLALLAAAVTCGLGTLPAGFVDDFWLLMLSLGIIDQEYAVPGTPVTLVWGEPDGGTPKPPVERHRQIEIRATVAPVPYAREVRETYHSGWRTAGVGA